MATQGCVDDLRRFGRRSVWLPNADTYDDASLTVDEATAACEPQCPSTASLSDWADDRLTRMLRGVDNAAGGGSGEMRYHPAIRLLWRAAPQEAFWWHLHNMPPRWALCVERRVFHNGMTARQAFSDCRAGMCAEVPVEKRAGGLVGLLALAAGAVIVLQEAKA